MYGPCVDPPFLYLFCLSVACQACGVCVGTPRLGGVFALDFVIWWFVREHLARAVLPSVSWTRMVVTTCSYRQRKVKEYLGI